MNNVYNANNNNSKILVTSTPSYYKNSIYQYPNNNNINNRNINININNKAISPIYTSTNINNQGNNY